jgi:hypothetical protein
MADHQPHPANVPGDFYVEDGCCTMCEVPFAEAPTYLDRKMQSSVHLKGSWVTRVMWEDPIVAEVHRTREMLAAKFNFNIDAIFADMQQRQVALGERLVLPGKRTKSTAEADEPGKGNTAH